MPSCNKLEELLPLLAIPGGGAALIGVGTARLSTHAPGHKEFEIADGIPILLPGSEGPPGADSAAFNHTDHYSIDAEVFDYFAPKSGATAHDERRVHEAVIRNFPRRADWMLDIGCGGGWLANKLPKQNTKLVSMDISLQNVRKTLDLNPSRHHYGIVGDGYQLPFGDNTFDCIICSEVIEHMETPGRLIGELTRCVRPNGTIIITTPYKETLKYTLCIHCNRPTPMNAHLHSFDEDSLMKAIGRNDSLDIKMYKFGNKALLHLRTYLILRFLNYPAWRLVDKLFNLFINKPAHILVKIQKSADFIK